MLREINECGTCDDTICTGCGASHVEHYFCDRCGEEIDVGFSTDREDLCYDCMVDMLIKEHRDKLVEFYCIDGCADRFGISLDRAISIAASEKGGWNCMVDDLRLADYLGARQNLLNVLTYVGIRAAEVS